jgi:rhomboid protease GluP
MEFSGGTQNPRVLMQFGMKINFLIIKGEYWRLISSAFIHIGIMHLIFNMYGLYSLGTLVENIYGTKKYVLVYFSAALWGSISSFIFSTNPSAGASGAIFGLLGAILFWGQKRPKILSTSFGINIIIVLVFNLINGFTTSGIDNYAHIGGLIGGFVAGLAAGGYKDKPGLMNLVYFIVLLALLVGGFLLGEWRWAL